MKYFFSILLLLILVGGAFGYWKYMYVYSEGTRDGVLLKISNKGTIFKTYEAEMMMPGINAVGQSLSSNYFYFSVKNATVAAELEKVAGKNVRLHYYQYNSSLPWRGDNYDDRNKEKGQYIVDKLEAVNN